MYICTVFELTT